MKLVWREGIPCYQYPILLVMLSGPSRHLIKSPPLSLAEI